MSTLALLVTVSASIFADAEPLAEVKPLAERVGALVEQLDAERRSERRAAERALLALGPDVLEHLPAVDLLPTASVREAVRRVRRELQRARALDSAKPETVTLSATNSLTAILTAVSEQTGNRFTLAELPESVRERSVTVDWNRRPFWLAVGEVLPKANVVLAGVDDDRRIVLRMATDSKEPMPLGTSASGPFRVEVTSLGRRPLFGSDEHVLLRVGVRVQAEPRLRPLFLALGGRDFTLSTTNGATFDPLNPAAKYELPLAEGERRATVQLDFRVPSDAVPETVRLAGSMRATVAAGTETIRFPPLADAKNVARRRGGVTVRVTDVKTIPGEESASAEIGLSIGYDVGGPAFESHRTWVFHNRVRLEDADGTAIDREGSFTTQLQANGAVAVRYRFDDLAGPVGSYRFVYEVPTLIVDVPITARFDELAVGRPSR